MINNDIYSVRTVHPHETGVQTRDAGRFMVKDGRLHILEDYHNILHHMLPEGDIDLHTADRIKRLPHASYLQVDSLRHNKPQKTLSQSAPKLPPSVFEYHRQGMDKPHTVELKDGNALLDGNALSHQEVHTILGNIRNGTASLRYKKGVGELHKMEALMQALSKADEELDPGEAFRHLQGAIQNGHLDPRVEQAMRRLVYEDKRVPGMGNKYAFEEFKARAKPGVYLSADLNDLKALNDLHGHEAGDAGIRAYGNAIRGAIDETVGHEHAKSFLPGGDEAVIHVPTHEHATQIARKLREKLEAVPAINGVHKLSAAIGIGHDFATADKALYEAKKQKLQPTGEKKYLPGQTPNFAHSLMPGHEGAVPLDAGQLPLKAPDVKASKVPAAPVQSVMSPVENRPALDKQ